MALQLDFDFFTATINSAYVRVDHVSGNKSSLHLTISVAASQQESHAGNYVTEFVFVLDGANLFHDGSPADRNYIKQTYEYMKSNTVTSTDGRLFNFTGATDV